MDFFALLAASLLWQGGTEIAVGGGTKGPWRQNESRYDYVDDPTVALDGDGRAVAAWVDQARMDVFLRVGGTTVNVSRSPHTFSWLPKLFISPARPDLFHLLWQEIIFSGGSHGGDILYARSIDGGKSFSPPVNLSRSKAGDGKGRTSPERWHNGSLDLAVGADGAVYAAWTQYEGGLLLAVSNDGGETFSAARQVAGSDARPARAPSLAVGPDRALYLAWTAGDVHVMRSTDGGATFGEPRVVAASGDYSDAPALAFGPQGVLHLAFSEGEKVLYSASRDGARRFAPPRVIAAQGKGFPTLEVDGQGNVYVLWELDRGLALAVSSDGGSGFRVTSPVPGSVPQPGWRNGGQQGLLMDKLAVNAAGEVAIVNSSFRRGEGSRVWLLRARPPEDRSAQARR